MSDHTPGPWWVHQGNERKWIVSKGDSAGHHYIAEVEEPWSAGHPTRWESNANMLAAAPDLREAAETALAVLERLGCRNEAERLVLARCQAAIAKAKGRE